jgi:hypothetical protein
MRSDDAGLTWSAAEEVARTTDNSDHPLLVACGTEAFLSWFTSQEGYRLIRIR